MRYSRYSASIDRVTKLITLHRIKLIKCQVRDGQLLFCAIIIWHLPLPPSQFKPHEIAILELIYNSSCKCLKLKCAAAACDNTDRLVAKDVCTRQNWTRNTSSQRRPITRPTTRGTCLLHISVDSNVDLHRSKNEEHSRWNLYLSSMA